MDIKQAYYDIGNAVKGVCDKVYAVKRPKSVDRRLESYVVVSLPYSIDNGVTDNDGRYNDYTTTVEIEVYVRDKMSAGNPAQSSVDVMGDKVRAVMACFPIMTESLRVTAPRVTLQTDDGDGFSVTIVQCRLRTR